jgi:hypothetical protein
MAIARDTNAEHIKPLEGAIIRRGILGATTEAGEIVALQSDGYWDPAIATAVVFTAAVAIQGGAAGATVDLVVFGPVVHVTGATPGALVYVSDTAGEPGASAGTKGSILGYSESAVVTFVQPQIVSFS